VKLDFWPSWKEYGQPDVLASVMDAGQKMLGRILVEVKLYSPKSGVADVDAESTTEEAAPDPDQLVKYWQGLKRITPSDVEAAIVYLTAHASPPVVELETAFRRMPGMRLGWLSWFEVEREARKIATATGDLPAADLSALLRHKGLSYFDGFKAVAPGARARGHFWKGASGQSNARRRWFGYPALVLKSRERLWRLR
jgi:hypothetical protein